MYACVPLKLASLLMPEMTKISEMSTRPAGAASD
jgi:hypothetical protein